MPTKFRPIHLVFLLPMLAAFVVFAGWPLVELARLSLFRTNFITTQWAGLDNFRAVFTDPSFLLSAVNSLGYMAFMTVLQVGGGLLIALSCFGLSKRWQDVARIVFYLPVLSAGIIISQSWRFLFHIEGPVNWLLSFAGVAPVAWFAQGATAIPAISLVIATSSVGSVVIVVLSAIMSIDKSIFDAARIDGASEAQIKRLIIIPLVSPTIGMFVLLAMIAAPQVFETIQALCPQTFAASVTYQIYREGFQFGHYGLAAAEAVVLLVFTVAMTAAKQRVGK